MIFAACAGLRHTFFAFYTVNIDTFCDFCYTVSRLNNLFTNLDLDDKRNKRGVTDVGKEKIDICCWTA